MAYSQTLTILDKITSEPVEFANVYSIAHSADVTTNVKGQADITSFKGAEKIEIRLLGYVMIVRSYAELESLNFEVLMQPNDLYLDEIVVSGTRWNQASGNVPSKIISISPKDVALQNPQTVADLLSISGKVYVQKSQQGGGSPMIRGFATNRLIYTIDGVRMNTAIFRGGNIQNVINLDPFATEKTEVFFGPGSVIYGSDAIGGVMSFQTLTPQFCVGESGNPLVSGKAISRYSSVNQERTAHFDVNVGWDKWAFVTSFSTWDFSHLRQGSHGPDEYIKPYYVQRQDSLDVVIFQDDPLLQIPTAYSQINLMQKIRFKPNNKWDFQYGFHYSETSNYGRYDRHNRMKNGTAYYSEWDYGPQKWMMNNLTITHNGQNAFYDKFSIRLALQSFEESRISRALNNYDRTTNIENVEAYSANLDFIKSVSKKNTMFYGFEYILNDVFSKGIITDISTNINMNSSARYPKSTWQSIGIYLNDEFKVSKKFTMQVGARYNQFMIDAKFDTTFYSFPFTTAKINNGALTGSIGGVLRPTDKWVINTNFGTAFRSPNVDDMGKVFESVAGSVVVPNTNLKAEYAYNFDLDIIKVFGDFLKIDITGYYTILKNAMVRRNFQLNGQDSIMYDSEMCQIQAIQNAAVAKVYGIQAGLEIKLYAGFSFSSDLNYQTGEEELDDATISPLRHAAPLFGVSRLTYKNEKLTLQFYSMYQAERKFEDLAFEEQGKDEIYAKDVNGNNYSPSWYTLNIKVMYNLSKLFTISAGVENITDQRYRPYSSGMSAPGRNFVISFTAKF